MTGKVLGVVGAGNIGSRTGELGAAWGMDVLGCVEYPSPGVAESLTRKGITLVDMDELLQRSDFVSVHVPLKDSTKGLIAARELDLMKRGAFLVNLARGGVVDEADLLRSLESGHLAGAGLDVHEREGNGNISPFAHLDNVILTPHIGAGTTDTQEEIGEVIVRCIEHAEKNPPTEKAIEANFIIM